MAGDIMIDDYITPIKKILADGGPDKRQNLRKLIYRHRKINSRHLRKRYTVDQTVKRLLEPGWLAKVRSFDRNEWTGLAEEIYDGAGAILGRVPLPEIILYPGFNAFNGRVYKINKISVIGCSPDFPHTTGINLKVLLAHEYAHFIRWRKTGIPTENVPVYSLIYEEGWATWLSIKLLPDLNLGRLFMSNLHKSVGMPDPAGGYIRWCRRNLDKIAGSAKKVLKSKGSRDLGRFFQCKRYWGEKTPIRVGYYLGYRLIDMLSEKMTPGQLLRLKPDRKSMSFWLDELINKGS
jgi:hypothetical protein